MADREALDEEKTSIFTAFSCEEQMIDFVLCNRANEFTLKRGLNDLYRSQPHWH